jgi:hypothetical protein
MIAIMIRATPGPASIEGMRSFGPAVTTARKMNEIRTVAAAPSPYHQTGIGDS